MKSGQINQLLEKYHRGATSLKEEQQLRELFLSGEYPPAFATDAASFLCFTKAAREHVPDPALEREIERLIRSLPDHARQRNKKRIPVLVAASLVLVAGLIVTWYRLGNRPANDLSDRDARLAYAETLRQMQWFSSVMNRSFAATSHLKRLDADVRQAHSLSTLFDMNNLNKNQKQPVNN